MNFLNAVYPPSNPFNEQVYGCESLSMNDILAMVWRHTDIFNEKTAQGFNDIINGIVEHLPRYQLFIKSLKEDGYLVVGYARKSINEKNDQARRNEDLLSKINADGDMQDMLQYISTVKKVCIVAINLAGLTTNQEDLKVFLK
ncbi:hypothetical protein BCV72DRAFT_198876 [Rhizopus microsporus var. microsporus]|uniref:Uncharacterized protein n=1 Tax=Rhizopus microsporus var. microsporus TaxID=86635 RepID=A0A1X0RFG8_RHIZD|nr:hypothetical protein BCV72DRAFT_198876 [Rhizopus microsporus var. microsporus]